MLKPLTLSLGLALALGMTSVSKAGLHDRPSPQNSVLPTGQSVAPCEQTAGDCDVLGPVKKHSGLFDLFKKKPKCYTYEWVLKKKRVRHGLFGLGKCGDAACTDVCGAGSDLNPCDGCGGMIYPSSQDPYASPQGGPAPYAAPQYLGSTQVLGTGQATGQTYAPAYAPAYAPTSAGQIAPAAPAAAADPAMTPPPAPRDEAPVAPEAPEVPEVPEVPSVPGVEPAPEAPAAPTTDVGGLLYLSPAGN